MDDLTAFLHQQFENQRFRGESLKTLAFALPPETGEYLTQVGDFLIEDARAKWRILDEHKIGSDPCDAHDASLRSIECDTVRLLALSFAREPGYRDEWRPA